MATAQKKKNDISVNVPGDAEAKRKALQTALSQIEKKHGAGSVMRLGDNAQMEVQAVSTGSIALDIALGIGGVPKGRIIEIFGPESSGKTTVALLKKWHIEEKIPRHLRDSLPVLTDGRDRVLAAAGLGPDETHTARSGQPALHVRFTQSISHEGK